jgi:hypothetical protein
LYKPKHLTNEIDSHDVISDRESERDIVMVSVIIRTELENHLEELTGPRNPQSYYGMARLFHRTT